VGAGISASVLGVAAFAAFAGGFIRISSLGRLPFLPTCLIEATYK
jgi:hypothetical protein